jgi:hypothetical protein
MNRLASNNVIAGALASSSSGKGGYVVTLSAEEADRQPHPVDSYTFIAADLFDPSRFCGWRVPALEFAKLLKILQFFP